MLSSSRWNSSHSTVVNAPIDVVWESLSDIHAWEWNRWVRLDANVALAGVSGRCKISSDGKRRWRSKDFTFTEVNRDRYVFSWTTKVGLGKCTNTMNLTPLGVKRTQLIHTQTFQGLHGFGFGQPFKRLRRYAFCINEALKNHVESAHFNSLLWNLVSTREMTLDKSDSTLNTENSENSRTDYWETPRHLRKELTSSFIEDLIGMDQ
jgi:hypothetical protein